MVQQQQPKWVGCAMLGRGCVRALNGGGGSSSKGAGGWGPGVGVGGVGRGEGVQKCVCGRAAHLKGEGVLVMMA